MGSIFSGASSFNMPLNSWNVARVTNLYAAFHGASAFNRPLNGWDVGQVSHMQRTFEGASAFNQPLAAWSTPILGPNPRIADDRS